jgi:hypothetical protein
MTIAVTVVVAVWNGAGFVDECVRSLLRQTMPADAFEVLFVDDGSTDDSLERIERAVAGRPQFQVVRSAHSGSYGAPRNLGLDRARGEFVLFMADDDALGPDALRRLCEFAAAHDADIVQPLLVSGFPEAAHPMYRRTVERCSLADADLAWALTDRKLFRRSFLAGQELRFDEGRRVMADAAFAAEAYCATDRVAVYADYPCYHWRDRHHAARGAGGLHAQEAWFGHVADLADTFASRLSGPARDRALGRVYEAEVHAQLLRRIDWVDPGQGFDAWYEEARKNLAAHMPSTAGPSSGVFTRVAGALLERGDRDRLVDWYRLMRSVAAMARLERAAWDAEGALEVGFTARLAWSDGAPVRFERVGDRIFLDRSLAERFGVDAAILDVTNELAAHTGHLSVAHRQEWVRWPCPAEFEQVLTDEGDGLTVAFNVAGAVPTEAYGGRERLSRGLWDVHVELDGFGISRSLRLGADRAPDIDPGPAVLGSPARGVIPFFTSTKGELTIDVGKKTRALAHALAGRRVERVDGALLLDAATAPSTAQAGSKLIVEDGAGAWYEVPVTVRPFEGRWRFELPRSVRGVAPGDGRLYARLDPESVPPLPLCDVHIGQVGALSADPAGRR